MQHTELGLHDNEQRLRQRTALIPILHAYYLNSGDTDLLRVAEELGRSCMKAHSMLVQIPRLSEAQVLLACALLDNYHITSDFLRLMEAIRLLEDSVSTILGDDEPPHLDAKIKLGQALFERFRVTEQIDDAYAAVDLLEGVAHSPDGNAKDCHRCLALSYLAIHKSGGLGTRALKLSAEDLPSLEVELAKLDWIAENWEHRPVYLVARAGLSFSQATTTKQVHYIDEGTKFAEDAVRDSPTSHPSRVQALFFIAKLSLFRGKLTADKSSIERALHIAGQTASLPLRMGAHDRSYALYDWGRCKIEFAHRKGDIDELESGLTLLESALEVCPNPHWNQKVIIETMSWGYGIYFEQSGHVRALDKIIGLPQLSPELVSSYPFFATNVAEAMILRARTMAPGTSRHLLKEAARIVGIRTGHYLPLRRTAETWEMTELNAKMIQATLLLEELHGEPTTEEDLSRMLQLARKSFELSIPEQRAPATTLLCQLLLRRGLALSDLAMVEEAERLLAVCLAEETTNRIYCTELLATQALALNMRFTLENDGRILDDIWRKYEEAVGDIGGRPRERFFAALKWAKCAQEKGIQNMALTAYMHAIKLLPRLAYLGHDIIGKLEILREVNGLASSSAAVALSLGQVDSAIEMLEQSRGIHWNRELQLRPPTDYLPEDVKRKLEQICRALNEEGLTAAGRREKAEELDAILHVIRSTEGTERFLLAPTIADLSTITRDLQAILAVVIPGEDACYVILIDALNDPKSMSLPITAARVEQMTKRMETLQSITGVRRRDARKVHFSASYNGQEDPYSSYITGILSELWQAVALPIIQALQLERIPNLCQRKRLIWCPVGHFNQLPLHAAGIYNSTDDRDELANYVLSSYTPTLAALSRAWTRHKSDSDRSFMPVTEASVLIVAQSQSATTHPLPMARVEVEVIKELLLSIDDILHTTTSSGVTVEDALSRLPDIQVLHLACHGQQDQNDVLNSGFELEDGRLTLGQLIKMNIPNAQLAYLSACETCGTDETRLDEGINLAATMLFVGFKSVIATMWAMDDVDGPFIAQRVYRSIFQGEKLDLSAVPRALDDAVRELRESGVPASRWATVDRAKIELVK